MKIYNVDCRYIRLNSSAYEKNYYLDNLKSVEIKASVNGGSQITEVITIDELTNDWSVTIAFDTNTRITQLYLKNLFTRQVYQLLAEGSSYAVNEANLDTIESLISAKLLSEFGISGTLQTHTISGSTLTYSISRLPFNLGASSVGLTRGTSSLNSNSYFSYIDSTKYIAGSESILITPEFFSLDSFTDGIYSIKVSTLDNDDILTEEETCFFMDCTIGQTLIDVVDTDECEVPDIRMLMMHYSLKVASNDECDCDKMQKIFNFLQKHIKSPNTDPCGC